MAPGDNTYPSLTLIYSTVSTVSLTTCVDWPPMVYMSQQRRDELPPREPFSKRVPHRPAVGVPEARSHSRALRSRPRRPPARTRTCSGMSRVMVPA